MKRVVCLLLCAGMLLSLLPAAVLAAEPGEPVLLPGVRLKEDNSQLYLGIGRFLYDDVELAGNSSFTAPGTETHWETFSVIL